MAKKVLTAGGNVAATISPELQLQRSVMSCMLWESNFYESGVDIAKRIATLIKDVDDEKVAKMAIAARNEQKLRHVPLWISRGLAAKGSKLTASTLEQVIQRADELAEFLALYWKDGKTPISAQVKKGLARAFQKFDEYQLAKYNRDNAITLRDVLFLVHAKPKNDAQAELWKRLVDDTLKTPDTWEVELSASKDKKASWTRLLTENKLGALALLRNLRNMEQAGISQTLVKDALAKANPERVLPFRYIPAAKAAPSYKKELEQMMFRSLANVPKLPGKTILVVDTSGSMYGYGTISRNSDISRVEAAGALAALIREVAEEPVLYATAGSDVARKHATALLPDKRGFDLIDVVSGNQMVSKIGGGGIFLVQCLDYIKKHEKDADRIIVITDEQDCDSHDKKPDSADAFGKFNYLINISTNQNGIGYGQKWVHIDGWSEQVINFIGEFERSFASLS